MRTAARTLVCLLLLGCPSTDPPVDPNDTGAETTTGDPTTGALGLEDTGFVDPTMGEPLDPDAGPDEICTHFCDRLVACNVEGDFDGCPCYPEYLAPFCIDEWRATVACYDETSCADLQDLEGPCWGMFEHAHEKCTLGESGCLEYSGSSADPPPGTCTFGRDCLDLPTREVACEADTCTCTIDDVPAGTCPGAGVCESDDPAAMSAKIDECCG